MSRAVNKVSPRSPEDLLRDRCDALRFESSLLDFTQAYWSEIEPQAFERNWHIEAICDHLEAVANREIKRCPPDQYPAAAYEIAGRKCVLPGVDMGAKSQSGQRSEIYAPAPEGSWRGPGVKFMHLSYEAAWRRVMVSGVAALSSRQNTNGSGPTVIG